MSDDYWPDNYFNYFTEIEERFQRARGTGLFLMSPLDWALIESWRNAGVPLEAVLKGIDDAFEKWRSRKIKRRQVNSLAYCSQAILEAAQRTSARSKPMADAPFAEEELRTYLDKAARAYAEQPEICASLQALKIDLTDLEDLERRLTTLEEKAVAILRSRQTDDDLYQVRLALDQELKPYRGKMSAEQLSMLERRYLDTALLDRAKLPRLSLFYLH